MKWRARTAHGYEKGRLPRKAWPVPGWRAWFLRCQDCGRRFCPKVQGTLYGVRAMVTRTIRCRACFSDPRVSEAELGPLVENRSIVHHIDGDPLNNELENLRVIEAMGRTLKIAVDIRGDEESYSATVLPDEGSFWRSIGLRPDDEPGN